MHDPLGRPWYVKHDSWLLFSPNNNRACMKQGRCRCFLSTHQSLINSISSLLTDKVDYKSRTSTGVTNLSVDDFLPIWRFAFPVWPNTIQFQNVSYLKARLQAISRRSTNRQSCTEDCEYGTRPATLAISNFYERPEIQLSGGQGFSET